MSGLAAYGDAERHLRFTPEMIEDAQPDELPELLREWAEERAPEHVVDTLELAADRLEAGETDEELAVVLLICARTRKDRAARKLILRAAEALTANS